MPIHCKSSLTLTQVMCSCPVIFSVIQFIPTQWSKKDQNSPKTNSHLWYVKLKERPQPNHHSKKRVPVPNMNNVPVVHKRRLVESLYGMLLQDMKRQCLIKLTYLHHYQILDENRRMYCQDYSIHNTKDTEAVDETSDDMVEIDQV